MQGVLTAMMDLDKYVYSRRIFTYVSTYIHFQVRIQVANRVQGVLTAMMDLDTEANSDKVSPLS